MVKCIYSHVEVIKTLRMIRLYSTHRFSIFQPIVLLFLL